MASSKGTPRRSLVPLIVMLAITAVAVAGFFVCTSMANRYTEQARAELQEQQAEAEAINTQIYEAYVEEVEAYNEQMMARESGANEAWPTPAGEGWEIVDLTNYPLENSYDVTMTRQETMYNGMLLVNEWHSRPDDFSEGTLVSLSSYSSHAIGVKDSSVKLFEEPAKALWDLVVAAKAAGMENYVIYDGYRTWDEQNELFQKRLTTVRKDHPNYSEERLIEVARRAVNYPGTSSYNGGNTFRVILYKRGDSTVNSKEFFECDEGLWFLEHCWEYGIVFRFQLADYPVKGATDKSYKTGVSSKLQTFTYVGKGNAAVMNALDLCVEEYIEYLMEHPHIAVFENGTLKYEIYRQQVGDAESFQVSMVGNSRVRNTVTSLDNMGYVITVFEY